MSRGKPAKPAPAANKEQSIYNQPIAREDNGLYQFLTGLAGFGVLMIGVLFSFSRGGPLWLHYGIGYLTLIGGLVIMIRVFAVGRAINWVGFAFVGAAAMTVSHMMHFIPAGMVGAMLIQVMRAMGLQLDPLVAGLVVASTAGAVAGILFFPTG